jgi:hypothetical protein
MKISFRLIYIIVFSIALLILHVLAEDNDGEHSYTHIRGEDNASYIKRVMHLKQDVTALLEVDPLPVNVFSNMLLNIELADDNEVEKLILVLDAIADETVKGDKRLLQLAPIFAAMLCGHHGKYRGRISPFLLLLDAGDAALPYLKELLQCQDVSVQTKRQLREIIDDIEYRSHGIEGMSFP